MARSMTPAGRLRVGLIFMGFAGLFMLIGAVLAVRQAHRLAVALPVEARIAASRVDSHRLSKGGMSYLPVVDYAYAVGGRTYEGHDPLPGSAATGSEDEAARVVARFPPGSTATAWYDPGDPASAFLLKEPSFIPYLVVLAPMLHAMVGMCLLLFSDAEPRSRPARMGIATLVWWGVGLAAAGHFAAIGGMWSLLPLASLGAYGTVGAGFAIAWSLMAAKVARQPDSREPRRSGSPERPQPFEDEPNPFRQR